MLGIVWVILRNFEVRCLSKWKINTRLPSVWYFARNSFVKKFEKIVAVEVKIKTDISSENRPEVDSKTCFHSFKY